MNVSIKPYGCSHCFESFALAKSLKEHVEKTHLQTETSNYKSAALTKKVQEHEIVDNSIKFGKLEESQESAIIDKLRLEQNLEKTEKIEGFNETLKLNHFCNICNKKFAGPETLKIHTRIIHKNKEDIQKLSKKKNFDDTNASKESKISKENRLKSVEKISPHGKLEKRYSCTFCQKSFKHQYTKDIHERIHTGKKPYLCKICSKAFRSKSILLQHEVTHTGEKRYYCKYCDKKFGQLVNCKRHERIHTG